MQSLRLKSVSTEDKNKKRVPQNMKFSKAPVAGLVASGIMNV